MSSRGPGDWDDQETQLGEDVSVSDIETIRERADNATPEPWEVSSAPKFFVPDGHEGKQWYVFIPRHPEQSAIGEFMNGPTFQVGTDGLEDKADEADAKFIAHARQDVGVLLDRLAASQAREEELRELIPKWDDLASPVSHSGATPEEAAWFDGNVTAYKNCRKELRAVLDAPSIAEPPKESSDEVRDSGESGTKSELEHRLDPANDVPGICGLCGQPMPPGEEMFRYHGLSGPCPSIAEPERCPRCGHSRGAQEGDAAPLPYCDHPFHAETHEKNEKGS